ncbi:MAG: methionine--tRNA ligase subunit beta, partial [Flavobacteriales bacterium]
KNPVLKTTKHWYLPLDKFQESWLEEWIDSKKGVWKTNVHGQCKSWLNEGLRPRAVTRDLDWGVPVPIEEAEGKVLYVWFDAPIGYISATKAWAKEKGEDWEKWWKDEETSLIHFIGKDNIVFHCLIFPAMLKEHGEFILPDNVPANEFLNLEGDKLSTSRNWAVWVNEYLEDFPERVDELRYVLTKVAPETSDNDFTWDGYKNFVNNELVATFGNFVNRAAVLIHKYFDGVVPEIKEQDDKEHFINDIGHIALFKDNIEQLMNEYKIREALEEFMRFAKKGNQFLADHEPWKLIKTDEERTRYVLNASIQYVAGLSILGEPFLPNTSKKIKKALNMESGRGFEYLKNNEILIESGKRIQKPELLFQKVEDKVVEAQKEKLRKNMEEKSTQNVSDIKPEISFDDFTGMDIRVGAIIEAEKVPKADKLLKLTVDTGIDKRIIVSGIAEHYNPDEIIGEKVTVLLNLAPKKIKGVESNGMILMAENEDRLAFIKPDGDLKVGSKVR